MREIWLFLLFVFGAAVSAGCDSGDDGRRGRYVIDGGSDGEDGGATADPGQSCSEAAEYVYVVDTDDSFYRFDPPAKQFELVGKLSCQAGGGSPFSMSVARDGTAYVLHQGGLGGCRGIFPVSVSDASCGDATAFDCGQASGFDLFGMGFATLNANTVSEELYIGTDTRLGVLDTGTWTVEPKGALTGNPEFTGNSKGELWGFFPKTNPPKVAMVDKATGGTLVDWPLPGISASPSAWAFAYWGGSFYIFYESVEDNSTNVYKVTDGVLEEYMMNTGKRIVGAGVSTCAPIAPPV